MYLIITSQELVFSLAIEMQSALGRDAVQISGATAGELAPIMLIGRPEGVFVLGYPTPDDEIKKVVTRLALSEGVISEGDTLEPYDYPWVVVRYIRQCPPAPILICVYDVRAVRGSVLAFKDADIEFFELSS